MKYWLADIDERNGEYEYTTPIRFKAKDLKEAISKQMYHVSTWYGKDNMTYDADRECYYNDYVAVSDGALTQIDKHTYEKLSGHYSLPDMSRAVT